MADQSIPDVTTQTIERFDDAVAHIRNSPTPSHVDARKQRMYRISAELTTRRNELMGKLEKGEAWLNAHVTVGEDGSRNGSNHPQWPEREAQWFAWEREYRVIQDALDRAKDLL